MLEDALDSGYESAKISMRVSRTAREMAAMGRPHGVAPYGYRRVFDQRTGKLINWEPDPECARVVLELFVRVRKGHSIRSIAMDFARRGIVNRSGTPFHAAHLRDMLTKPAYTGIRNYKGEMIEAVWEPIVDRALFYDVQRIISAPERKTTRHGRAVHEFSMILRCAVCGGPQAVTNRSDGKRPGRPQYQCHTKGCVRIDKDGVDKIVTDAIINYLSREDLWEELSGPVDGSADLERLTVELAELRTELAEVEHQSPKTVYEAKTFAALQEGLTQDISTKEAHQRELTTPPALMEFLMPGVDPATCWESAPISTRREVAGMLLSPRYLGEVRIVRRPPVGNRRVPARDRMVWRR